MNSKEQPKKTIEEVAKELYQDNIVMDIDIDNDLQNAFVNGYNHAQTEIEQIKLDFYQDGLREAYRISNSTIEQLKREMFTNMNQYAYYFEKCYAERPMKKPLSPSEWFEQQLITKHK